MACASPQVWGPTNSDCSERCREHSETPSVFCLDDLEPLCQRCAAECHSQHRVYLLSDAVTDCKGELYSALNNLKQKLPSFEKVSQNYQQVSKHNQAVAEFAEEQVKKEFEQLHEILLKEEANRLLLLRREKEMKVRELCEQTKNMDEVVRSLEDRIRLVEAELESEGDGAQFLKDYQEPKQRQCTDFKKSERTFLINVAEHLGNLKFCVWNKMKDVAPYTPVTLDPRTAGHGLTVSYPLNTVHCTPGTTQQELLGPLNNPDRFHPYSCVLGREGFSSGVHCWEIQVGDCENWTVGVVSQSTPRQQQFEACPEAGLWCISLRDGQYLALTTPAQMLHVDKSGPLKRVGVKLDWEEAVLEFYNADTGGSIFTFKHRFNEKVYPYFESISKTGSLSLVAKEASVSVKLDGEVVEDSVIDNEEIHEKKNVLSKKNKKKRIIKNGLIKTKPAVNQTPRSKILFSEDYHVSLFRSLKITNTEAGDQKIHG